MFCFTRTLESIPGGWIWCRDSGGKVSAIFWRQIDSAFTSSSHLSHIITACSGTVQSHLWRYNLMPRQWFQATVHRKEALWNSRICGPIKCLRPWCLNPPQAAPEYRTQQKGPHVHCFRPAIFMWWCPTGKGFLPSNFSPSIHPFLPSPFSSRVQPCVKWLSNSPTNPNGATCIESMYNSTQSVTMLGIGGSSANPNEFLFQGS